MTLEYSIDSLDGLEENISALYVEREGKYFLDVTGHENADDKNKIPRSRLNQEIDKRKNAEKQLQIIAEDLKSGIPEDFQEIVPDLPPAKMIAWIRSAEAKGLFTTREPDPIDNKRPGDKAPVDFEKMSPQAIMSRGYKT